MPISLTLLQPVLLGFRFVPTTLSNGSCVAYDAIGDGPPLVLLHGGFIHNRHSLTQAGYVDRLKSEFRLLVIDLRAHGESSQPTTPDAYASGLVCDDILDAERVARASVWGYSRSLSSRCRFPARRRRCPVLYFRPFPPRAVSKQTGANPFFKNSTNAFTFGGTNRPPR